MGLNATEKKIALVMGVSDSEFETARQARARGPVSVASRPEVPAFIRPKDIADPNKLTFRHGFREEQTFTGQESAAELIARAANHVEASQDSADDIGAAERSDRAVSCLERAALALRSSPNTSMLRFASR